LGQLGVTIVIIVIILASGTWGISARSLAQDQHVLAVPEQKLAPYDRKLIITTIAAR
jgi:hypothetical protein